jgi:hypothetical protein
MRLVTMSVAFTAKEEYSVLKVKLFLYKSGQALRTQEVEASRILDSWHIKVVRLSPMN